MHRSNLRSVSAWNISWYLFVSPKGYNIKDCLKEYLIYGIENPLLSDDFWTNILSTNWNDLNPIEWLLLQWQESTVMSLKEVDL